VTLLEDDPGRLHRVGPLDDGADLEARLPDEVFSRLLGL
jgi:hypothetical protein